MIASYGVMDAVFHASAHSLRREARCLRAARRLSEARRVGIRTTFLGAHALPPEAAGDRDAYVTLLVENMLPALAAAGLVLS